METKWIVGGIAAGILGWFLLRKNNTPPPVFLPRTQTATPVNIPPCTQDNYNGLVYGVWTAVRGKRPDPEGLRQVYPSGKNKGKKVFNTIPGITMSPDEAWDLAVERVGKMNDWQGAQEVYIYIYDKPYSSPGGGRKCPWRVYYHGLMNKSGAWPWGLSKGTRRRSRKMGDGVPRPMWGEVQA